MFSRLGFVFLVALVAPILTAQTGSGTVTGLFSNPSPPCAAPTDTPNQIVIECSGLGTDTLTWGDSNGFGTGANKFAFTGGSFNNVVKGQTFVAGLLYYFNGTTVIGTSISSVNIQMVSHSSTAAFDQQQLNEPIAIVTTPNNSDVVSSADYIYFPNHPELGSFRVIEGASATVPILVKFGSLELVGFGQPVIDASHPDSKPENGFLFPSVEDIPDPTQLFLSFFN